MTTSNHSPTNPVYIDQSPLNETAFYHLYARAFTLIGDWKREERQPSKSCSLEADFTFLVCKTSIIILDVNVMKTRIITSFYMTHTVCY